jgi:hypothetical protein
MEGKTKEEVEERWCATKWCDKKVCERWCVKHGVRKRVKEDVSKMECERF